MGVDIATYRGRIGTFGHGCGQDVYTTETVIDFTRSLKSIGTVVFIGLLLVIAGVESNPGPKDEAGGGRCLQNNDEVPSHGNYGNRHKETKFLKIKGLPHDTSGIFLKMFCHHKGQGRVRDVSIDGAERTALIEFEEVCAARRFLDSQPIVIQETHVEVMPHYHEALRSIKITYLPCDEDVKHILWYYFENIEGELISRIYIDREKDFAIVTFASAEVARRMVERKSFRIDDLCLLVSGIDEADEGHLPPLKPENDTKWTLPRIDSEDEYVETDTYRESAKIESKLVSNIDSADALNKSESDDTSKYYTAERPSRPNEPFIYKNVTKDSVQLSWKQPDSDGGSIITNYTIEKRDKSNTLWSQVGKTSDENIKIALHQLQTGSELMFRVSAVNKIGSGEPLEMTEYIAIKSPYDVPSTPKGPLSVSDVTETGCTLKWKPSEKDGGVPIIKYIIESRESRLSMWSQSGSVDNTTSQFSPKNLNIGYEYIFRVKALNDEGESSPLESETVVPKKKIDVPVTPASLNVTRISPNSIDLQWTPPNRDGGANVKAYHVYVATTRDDWQKVGVTKGFDNKCTVPQLTEGHSYYFAVAAENEGGLGSQCELDKPVVAQKPKDVPSKPKGPLAVCDITDTGCTLKWKHSEKDGGLPITKYIIESRESYCSIWSLSGSVDYTTTQFSPKNMNIGYKYIFRVKAENDEGDSFPLESEPVVLMKTIDVPVAPASLNVTKVSSNSIDLQWTSPNRDGGANVKVYHVYMATSAGEWQEICVKKAVEKKCTVSKLTEGQSYYFAVAAENEGGLGSQRELDEPVVAQKPNEKPSKPNEPFICKIINKDSVELSWNRPDRDGGSKITNYAIEIRANSDFHWSQVGKTSIATSKILLKQIQTGSKLMFRVSAVNKVGTSEPLTMSKYVKINSSYEVPSIPKGPLSASGITEICCTLNWKPPKKDGGLPITKYIIESRESHCSVWSHSGTVDATETQFSPRNMSIGYKYIFRIKAVNDKGESSPLESKAVELKKKIDVPMAPAFLCVTKLSSNSIDLQWTPQKKDKGAKVKAYHVYMATSTCGWQEVGVTKAVEKKYTVSKLTEGLSYHFAVAAENEGGLGPQCKLCKPVVVGKTKDSSRQESFQTLLTELELENEYPGKITMSTVLSLDLEPKTTNFTHADLPWLLLRFIVLSHSDCRDRIMADALENMNPDRETDLAMDVFESNDNKMTSPLDIFHIVIQCCDPFVQSLLYKKMLLCKIAVPFRSWQGHCQDKLVFLWPLRSVIIAHCGTEFTAAQVPTYTLACTRMGRPTFSKSKFLNDVLSENDIFFSKDSPLGTAQRHISPGCTEMFWRLTEKDILTVFNLRGDLNTQFSDTERHFLSQMADILCIVVELDDIEKHLNELDVIVKERKHVILLVNNPRQGLDSQKNLVRKFIKKGRFKILVTCKKGQAISPLLLTAKIQTIIFKCLSDCKCDSLEYRLSSISSKEIDESNSKFTQTKQQATKVINSINKAGQNNVKAKITPAHSMFSKSLGLKRRKLYRSKMEEGEKVNIEIKNILDQQIKSISPIVKEFLDILIQFKSQSVGELQLFITWVSGFLDLKMRDVLPDLKAKNKHEYEVLWDLKIKSLHPEDINAQEKRLKLSYDSIRNVFFSVSHLFREIAHVYEACYQTSTPLKHIQLPDTNNVVDVFAELIINGYPFELLNGNDNYMPITWIKSVIKKVHERIGEEKVCAVSILGIQSSGKSTFLNTMFGSQFAVSSGRCTRGVHLQLLTVKEKKNQPFKYVLLIDTEGLRAPELGNNRYNHDNELATFVTGLGDMTILNIMGENMSEISEILQIMVHAFLRLRLVNKSLDMNKSCMFVHHNVADILAAEKMHQGFQKIMTTLDKMTKEAAASEGISDIVRFSQVINFDIKSHIWFFPNLWQGNPPFARVNKKYSEKVFELRSHMLRQAFSQKGKAYKTLDSTLIHINDLWKGVLKEDFVFSFRNSFEIKAYCWLEKMFQEILWKHDRTVMHELQEIASTSFSVCDSTDHLESQHARVKSKMSRLLIEKQPSTEEMLSSLFENNEFKEIIDTWKDKRGKQLQLFWVELRAQCDFAINRLYQKRNVELRTTTMCQEHEQKLYDMSKKLAARIKNLHLNTPQRETQFEELWKEFEKDLPLKTETKCSMFEFFESNLKDILHKDHYILSDLMIETKWPECDNNIQNLKSSIDNLNVEDSDLSSTTSINGTKAYLSGKVKTISPDIISLFTYLDKEIGNTCNTDCEILEQHVKEFLHKIEEWTNRMSTEKDRIGMTLTSIFIIKIYVYASRYAAMKFNKHNEIYEQKYGITAHLLRYKQQAKLRLDAMIADRSAEDTAAILFATVIEEFVKDEIKCMMSTEVCDQLLQDIPRPKYNLMIEIVTDLARTGEFEDWMKYLISAEEYSRGWVVLKCKEHLFGNKGTYSKSAHAKACMIFEEIKNAVNESLDKESPVRKTEVWIQSFIKGMIRYPISLDKFNNVIVGFKEITAKKVGEFSTLLLEKIEQSQRRIEGVLKQTTDETVVWVNENPYDKTFDRVWGCTETCPFCGETCARSKSHGEVSHHCIQHRPSGCLGVHASHSKEISLSSCNYDVQSDGTHMCAVFDFKCNKKMSESCPLNTHNYREYKKVTPYWDIEPSPNMDDTSKIWMWFMGNFKEDLKKRFDIIVDNVPDRWSHISKEDAIKSYGELIAATK